MEYIIDKYVKERLTPRRPDTHKGDYGKVLIYAGSEEMAGAAVLAARGALRTGSGLVYLCVPREMFSIFQIAIPEAVCVSRKDISRYDIYDSIIFGPGLGIRQEDAENLDQILKSFRGTAVIDADGLNIISKYDMYEALRLSEADIVITPHMGEAARLLGKLPEERDETARDLYEKTRAVSVVKGSGTIVMDGRMHINTTGNPGMATAGSGDVLSGIIGSLAGQGYAASDAACLGVFLHGYAGDMAAAEHGQWGITASDIAGYVSKAIRDMLGE